MKAGEAVKTLSIIIPAYNEEESIKPLVERIVGIASDTPLQIILVDDGSRDRTYSVMKRLVDTYNQNPVKISVEAYSLCQNSGKSAALMVGFNHAKGSFVALMDADLQDDPSYLPRFLKTLKEGQFDLIVGNRTNRYQRNVTKRLSSWLVNVTMRRTFGYLIHDMNCGYKMMTSEVAKRLKLKTDYHRFIPLLTMMNGYSVGEMEIKQKDRQFGQSKYGRTGLLRGTKFLVDFLSLAFIHKFREKPFKLFGETGLVLFSTGFLIALYLSVRWLLGFSISGRPLFFASILLIIIGVNIVGLGLLGELITFGYNDKEQPQLKEYRSNSKT